MSEDLKVLILAGGASSRMGMDKGVINYHGKKQKYHLADIIYEMGLLCYISQKEDQLQNQGYQYIIDKHDNAGPMAGILSAHSKYPSSWLVIGCDYPFLKKKDINFLIKSRDLKLDGCFYENEENQIIIPTVGIYEKSIFANIQLAFQKKNYALYKTIKASKIKTITSKSKCLESVDTYERYIEIKNHLNGQ